MPPTKKLCHVPRDHGTSSVYLRLPKDSGRPNLSVSEACYVQHSSPRRHMACNIFLGDEGSSFILTRFLLNQYQINFMKAQNIIVYLCTFSQSKKHESGEINWWMFSRWFRENGFNVCVGMTGSATWCVPSPQLLRSILSHGTDNRDVKTLDQWWGKLQ